MAPKELTDDEMIKLVNEACDEAWEVVNSTNDWKEIKKVKETNEVVEAKKNKKGRKMFRITSRLPISPETLVRNIKDRSNDGANYLKWNKTVIAYKELKKINDNVFICYQCSDDAGPGGVVSKRDFVLLLKEEYRGDTFVQGGTSVEFPGAPKDSKIVRAVGYPGVQIVKPVPASPNECDYAWVMDADFKGWLPSSVIESAMPHEMLKFTECARKLK